MAVTSYTSDGHIAEMQRSATSNGNTTTESWLYSYLPTGNANAGLLSKRDPAHAGQRRCLVHGAASAVQPTTTARRLRRQPRRPDDRHRRGRQRQRAVHRATTATTRPATANGYTHGLEYVFNPASYTRLTAALGTNLGSLTDAQVAPYADNYFQYDSQQRVTQETVQGAGDSQTGGGLGTYTFSYTASSNTPGFNSWAMKTVVTNPDGSTDTVYTNCLRRGHARRSLRSGQRLAHRRVLRLQQPGPTRSSTPRRRRSPATTTAMPTC